MENTKNFQELAAEARKMNLSLVRHEGGGVRLVEIYREGTYEASVVTSLGSHERVLLAMISAALEELRTLYPSAEQLETTGVA